MFLGDFLNIIRVESSTRLPSKIVHKPNQPEITIVCRKAYIIRWLIYKHYATKTRTNKISLKYSLICTSMCERRIYLLYLNNIYYYYYKYFKIIQFYLKRR